MAKPLHIFRAGKHVSNDGRSLTFSDADLSAIASSYSPGVHEAPLVVGHPQDNAPAYGWVESLRVAQGSLFAVPTQVDPAFAELVASGRFKKISASFYHADSPLNPKPGAYYLRHIGFLGAMPPAIKGLGSAQFSGSSVDVVEVELSPSFQEQPKMDESIPGGPQAQTPSKETEEKLSAREAQLAEREKAIADREAELAQREKEVAEREEKEREEEAESFSETLVKAGKVLPRDKAPIAALLSTLKPDATLSFSDSDGKSKKTLPTAQWLKSFLERQPKQIEYGEVAPSSTKPPADSSNADALAKRAREIHDAETAAGRTISYAEAVNRALKGTA